MSDRSRRIHRVTTMSGEQMGGVGAILTDEIERALVAGEAAKNVILVEGVSDRRAIETLARRRQRDLDSDGVVIIPIAGATNIGRFLELLGPEGYDVELAGLCDEGEASEFRVALERAGLGTDLDRSAMERLGFHVCVRDLEDELIRSLGAEVMMSIMRSEGHLRRFRSFQNQPAQRHKTIEDQIWRWLGNHKIRYAALMVEALDLADVPAPLDGVLKHV